MKKKHVPGVRTGSLLLLSKTLAIHAVAACNSNAPLSNASVTCSGSSFAPVIARSGSTNVSVIVAPGASGSFVHASSPIALSVEQSSTATSNGTLSLTGGGGTGTQRGAVLLAAGNGNRLTNGAGATIDTAGAFNDAMAANGSGNTLTNLGAITTAGPNGYGMTAAWGQTNVGQLNNTLVNAGLVSTSGTNARAASILGGSGTISNSGTLSTSGAMSPAAYMQGNNDQLINTGSINATGQGSDAVFSNTASSSFNALIENRTGGQIVSQRAAGIRTLNGNSTVINAGLVQSGMGTAISMGGGNDALILQTGSTIVGSADGGTGTNTVTLQGNGTAANAFTNFQTLLMQGTRWNWTGTGTFSTAHVQSGTLALTGTLNAPARVTATIDAGATIIADAGNLPLHVIDNGLVNFAQEADGTYSGSIEGAGAVQKNGAGTLTLAPSATSGNTYSGGTLIAGGVVAIAADNALGASTGRLAFDGGTLQLNQSFDLAATRTMTLSAAGGTIDTQAFDSTLTQPVTGNGTLTKTGAGMLLMNGVSTYSGATNVTAGTLAVGDPMHTKAALAGGGGMNIDAGSTVGGYGSISGAVTNNGTLAVANALPAFAAASNGIFNVNGALTNAALVRIGGPAGTTPGNVLRVAGNYAGRDGAIALNTVVGFDDAPSDRLVIDGGSARGSTVLQVANAGGTGARTAVNGIRVVEAANGATTDPSAFRLSAPIKAGAYTYYLAKGGVTAGTANDWFLRNTVAPQPALPQPVPPSGPGAPPSPPPSTAPPPLPFGCGRSTGCGRGHAAPARGAARGIGPDSAVPSRSAAVCGHFGCRKTVGHFADRDVSRSPRRSVFARRLRRAASRMGARMGQPRRARRRRRRKPGIRWRDIRRAGRPRSVCGCKRERRARSLRPLYRICARNGQRQWLRTRRAESRCRASRDRRVQRRRLLDAYKRKRLVHRYGFDGRLACRRDAIARRRRCDDAWARRCRIGRGRLAVRTVWRRAQRRTAGAIDLATPVARRFQRRRVERLVP